MHVGNFHPGLSSLLLLFNTFIVAENGMVANYYMPRSGYTNTLNGYTCQLLLWLHLLSPF